MPRRSWRRRAAAAAVTASRRWRNRHEKKTPLCLARRGNRKLCASLFSEVAGRRGQHCRQFAYKKHTTVAAYPLRKPCVSRAFHRRWLPGPPLSSTPRRGCWCSATSRTAAAAPSFSRSVTSRLHWQIFPLRGGIPDPPLRVARPLPVASVAPRPPGGDGGRAPARLPGRVHGITAPSN